MTIKELADQANWILDQIPAFSEAKLAMLSEEAHFISKSVSFVAGKAEKTFDVTLDVDIYWAPKADIVLLQHQRRIIYPRGILFDGFAEFLLWFGWKMRAAFGCSEAEMDRLRDEIDCWRIKIISPPLLNQRPRKVTVPLETTLELL